MSFAMPNIRLNPFGVIVLVVLGGGTLLFIQRTYYNGSDTKANEVISASKGELISMKELLAASIQLAERGGVVVKAIRDSHRLNEASKGKTKEGMNNPVTDGDMKSHEAIVSGFKKSFPSVFVVSEEHEKKEFNMENVKPVNKDIPIVSKVIQTDEKIPSGDITVWVDPLDATQEYTEDLLQYVTTMVCVAVKGRPVIGVIHKPFLEEGPKTSWAWVGKGHAPHLQEIKYDANILKSPRIIVSRSHAGDVEKVAKTTFGESTEVIPAGGAGFKVMSLLEGKADAYVHVTLIKKWDICAGNAILQEMNSKMSTLEGGVIDYDRYDDPKNPDGLLATIWDHEQFLEKLKPVYERMKAEKS
ncbi:Golgi-resident adenosine 3',5'-bisphosphate 3'-phosphatase-like [Diadema antillarum]|uniref:Golgi-resident adenosine 3',5'-bisphosphate 3'-phosphatase-like n=1 Tax=Diadema antillarum TaxID=105358 RepID=UPI003A8BC21D